MKLVVFSDGSRARRPGLLNGDNVVEIGSDLLPERDSPRALHFLIDRFDAIRSGLERLAASSGGRPLAEVNLHAPLPRRNKVLSSLGNTRQGVGEAAPAVFVFVKGAQAIGDPDAVIDLPNFGGREVFTADAALAMVIKGPAHRVVAADWRSAVFGYTAALDVTARTVGLYRCRPGTCIGAACDNFAPIGPVLVTADEIPDPSPLRVRQWNNGEARQDFRVSDMIWRPDQLIETASLVMTLYSGDAIICAGDPAGQGPLQEGDKVAVEVDRIGRMTLGVSDALHRTWDRAIRVGAAISRDASMDVLRDRAAILAENAL